MSQQSKNNIRLLSEISEGFLDLQNKVAKEFKSLVTSIYSQREEIGFFTLIMKALFKQHEAGMGVNSELLDYVLECEYVQSLEIEWDTDDITNSLYILIMNQTVYYSSEFSIMDEQYEGLFYEYGYDYGSMYMAFLEYSNRALKTFIKGNGIKNKVFKQLAIINIVNEYQQNNIKLTLRQLYYQMVSKNYIPNLEAEYKKIIDLTGSMRGNNILTLDEFADNTRFAIRYRYEDDIENFIKDSIRPGKYNLDTRKNQPYYLEVWIEKEALRSVFKPITDKFDIPLFICRGYPSTSSLFQQGRTILFKTQYEGKERKQVIILYYGDHDPSGKQIPEAIQSIFYNNYQMKHVEVRPMALNMDQVRRFKLPPNPAKITDPRAGGYIAKWGAESWELDAVPPVELQKIVEADILRYSNIKLINGVINKTKKDREKIKKMRDNIIKKMRTDKN
ncbi:MAG: hypothetical protein A4E53_02466 [Pelotomaculum sp. PtaB.Bin104]|nr:MAG: hypothetical protein A4E53_02466 [Pelotomaculum sp. PtaB.Bin104]